MPGSTQPTTVQIAITYRIRPLTRSRGDIHMARRSSTLGRAYPKIQILTVEDILAGRLPDLPGQESQIRRRNRISAQRAEQQHLPLVGG